MVIGFKGGKVVQGRRKQKDYVCVGGVQGSEMSGDYGLDLRW